MAANRDNPDDLRPIERPDAHEEKDVDTRAIVKFAIALVVLCVVSVALLFGLFRYYESREARRQLPLAEGLDLDVRRLPPEPRLQDAPVLDLKQMRDAEDQILGTYDWIDRQNGIVRLPINRAIEILGKRGLPAQPRDGSQTGAANVSVPAESGLGPKMVQPGGPLASELEGM
jgi:hypothetical protein